jgi:hypothetical protein
MMRNILCGPGCPTSGGNVRGTAGGFVRVTASEKPELWGRQSVATRRSEQF